MTKRSGRSRRSKRRSAGADTSTGSESTPITPEVTDAEAAEARLRAEAERRADEALTEITREDAKADEDRRLLRENGILVDDDDSATSAGDTAVGEDTTTDPETFSSDAPAPGETSGTAEVSDDQSDPGVPASSTHQDDASGASEPQASESAHPGVAAQATTPDRHRVEHSEYQPGSSETESSDEKSGDTGPVIARDIEDMGSRPEDASPSAAGESTDSEAEPSSEDARGTGARNVTVPDHLLPPDEPEDDNPSRGWVKISEKTVTKIVRQAAASVPGTTEHSGGLDVLGRGYPRFDVELDSNSDAVSIDAYIAVTWPAPVTRVAETVRTTIFDWIRDMTDIPVVRVNVTVGPIVPGGERVTEAELASFGTTPLLRPVVVTARNASLDAVRCTGDYGNLRGISVDTGPRELAPIQVSDSDHSDLRNIEVAPVDDLAPISVADSEDLREISVADSEDLREISVTGDAAASVFSPTVSPEADLRPITVPEAPPLKGISVPEPTPLRTISATELPTFTVATPPAPEPISVRVPDAPEPRSVTLPEPAPLRKVEAPRPRRLRSVHAPDTHRLAQIHAEAPRVSPVKPPRPARVRPVRRNPLQVDKKPRVDRKVDNVLGSASEAPLTPRPRELRPITVKRTTITPVHVDPANAKAVLRDE